MAARAAQVLPRSQGQRTWRRFKRNKMAVASMFVMLLIVAMGLFAPLISPYDPLRADLKVIRMPPTRQHLLGTDMSGRDVLARIIYGGRVTFSVGIVAVLVSMVIGTLLGGLAGYGGGATDFIISRITDTVMCFPTTLALLTVVSITGPDTFRMMIVFGVLSWTGMARLVRGQFLSLSQTQFVEAARCIGASSARIIFTHIMPNVVGPLVVAGSFGIAGAILNEAGLSFLGLGVPPPQPSWGQMLGTVGFTNLQMHWWLWIPPGLMISLTVLSINFIGDALREAVDPRSLD